MTETIDRAIAFALETQRPDGSWDGPLASRTFETALVALALRRLDDDTASCATAWLRHNPVQSYNPVAYVYESILNAAVLGCSEPFDFDDEALADPTFLRKSLAVYVMARRHGVTLRSAWSDEKLLVRLADLYACRAALNIKGWALCDFLSLYALFLGASGDNQRAMQVAAEVLKAQSENGSWYHNVISTSLALCALQCLDGVDEHRRRAAAFLRDARQADGGWSYCNIPVWDTALTMTALGLPAGHPAMRRGAAYLLAAQNADGGWGFIPGLESENDSSSAAIDAVGALMPSHRRETALRFLQEQQREEGYWPVWRRDEKPSMDVVAHIVATLRQMEPNGPTRFDRADAWLLQQQREDGSWRADWYANVPYAIEGALRAIPLLPPERAERASHYLRSSQNHDGGWGGAPGEPSNASATACAILACLRLDLLAKAASGIDYLQDTQLESGTWRMPREMIGPRPLRYAVHASSHALCVRALRSYQASAAGAVVMRMALANLD